MGGNSIVATFGGDTGPLKAAFSKAAAMAKENAREQGAAYSQLAKAQEEQLKLEKLRATAAGNHAIADAIQDEIDLRTESLRLTKELGIAEHQAIAIAKERLALNRQIAASQSRNEGAGKGGKGSHEGSALSGGGIARLAGDTINSATGGSGAVSLLNIFRHIPGPVQAIVAVGAALKKLHASITALDEVNQSARKETLKNTANAVNAGPDAVRAAVEAKNAEIEKLRESSSGFSHVNSLLADRFLNFRGAGVRSTVGGFDISTEGNAYEKSVRARHDLENQRADLVVDSSKRTRKETSDRASLATGSLLEKELFESRLKEEKDIADIRNKAPQGASPIGAEVDNVKGERAQRDLGIFARSAIRNEQLGLEQELAHIHTEGAEEEVRSAEARLRSAQVELGAAQSLQDVDRKAAEIKVQGATTELELTKRRRAELVDQLALQNRIANLIAPGSEKHSQDIAGQIAILDKQIRTARPDELKQLQAERAGKLAEQRDDERSKLERRRHSVDSRVEENTGFGDAEHLAALSQRIRLGAQRIAADEEAGTVEADQLAANRAQQAILIRERDHLLLIKGREVGYAKEGNKILEAEIGRHSALAERLRTELSFEEQINQARDNGDSARVKELQQAKQLTLEKQAQAVAIAKADRTRLSLSELAKNGEGKTGAVARRIVRLEERAAREAGRGNQRAAQKYQSQADKLRNGLDALKDGEKPRDGSVDAPGAQNGSRGTDFKGTFKKRTPQEIEAERHRQVGPSDFKKLFPTRDPGQAGGLGVAFLQLLPLLAQIAANTGRFVIKNR